MINSDVSFDPVTAVTIIIQSLYSEQEILYLESIFSMTESAFLHLKSRILRMLGDCLDPKLTYHSPGHTEDVLLQAERIAAAEHISDDRLLLLIKIAALFHDTGFLYIYKGHEKRSCEIMLEKIDIDKFDKFEIKMMSDMIMATKVPQSAVTLPEMILCDADLDYLGRSDFDIISSRLKSEFLTYAIVKNEKEWDKLQVKFFKGHRYYTATSVTYRNPVKMQHLELLKQKLRTKS